MRTPPPIPLHIIDEALHRAFPIEGPAYTFVRGGEDAWGFNIASPSGAYRLKLYNNPEHIDVRLEAMYYLRHECAIAAVVAPLRLPVGGFSFDIAGRRAALFPYVFGTNASSPAIHNNLWRDIGVVLARIHQTDFGPLALPVEDFETRTADAAQSVVDALPQAVGSDNPYRRALAELLLPIKDMIERQIEHLRTAASAARAKPLPMVLCHGDPTNDNILIGAEGVSLIDWDDMRIAPKELDLQHFGDEHPLYSGYGPVTLDRDALRYYHGLWNNEEIAGFGGRILFEDLSSTQQEHDLAQLQNFLHYSGLGAENS